MFNDTILYFFMLCEINYLSLSYYVNMCYIVTTHPTSVHTHMCLPLHTGIVPSEWSIGLISTLNHIFTLHLIIELYLHSDKRVYTVFIDYKKAFDFI